MFGNNKKGQPPGQGAENADRSAEELSAPPLKPFSRKGTHAPAKPPAATTFQPEIPRRVPDIPGIPGRRIDRPAGGESESKRLFIGRDIRLSGEITACDRLVVEGQVEVTLSNARAIEVAETGIFRGTCDVEEADISGRYGGELIARDRLVVRAGGRIAGTIRYGRIVIESGGEISGDMKTIEESIGGGENDEALAAETAEPAG